MNREEARKKAEALVAKMTVEEKAGQLKFDAPSIERLGIPAYNWWNEALHGVARAGVWKPELLLFSRRRSHWLQCLMIKN